MKNLPAFSLAAALMVLGTNHFSESNLDDVSRATMVNECRDELAVEPGETSTELAKLSADVAAGKTCEQFAQAAGIRSDSAEAAKAEVAGKQVTVSSLVSRALSDQKRLLVARQADLERWGQADQLRFAKWFGTTSLEAREIIYERIQLLLLLNKEYTVGNFRKAVPSKLGLFAFVHPTDPSKIFVDQAFVTGSFVGENSRAGTLCHEMSHFVLAGGTKDLVYGVPGCKRLARQNPAKALANADNFEFFIENVQ